MANIISDFHINIPEADIDDLRSRLENTRFTSSVKHVEDTSAVPVADMRDLTSRWLALDWRAVEDRLNTTFRQKVVEIDGQVVHFSHHPSVNAGAPALVLLHGWPSSFIEFEKLIPLLTNEFSLVIPSLPGFAFSPAPNDGGWGRVRTASLITELMHTLGYDTFLVHGGDLGSYVACELARSHSDAVLGVHVDQVYSMPSDHDSSDSSSVTDDEREEELQMENFVSSRMAYIILHSTQPQTASHAFADSPLGQLAWSYQLFGKQVPADFILTNASVYWYTECMSSAMRFYWEDNRIGLGNPPIEPPTTVPVGVVDFPYDFTGIRHLAERDHSQIVRWTKFDDGGHYPSEQVPQSLAEDIAAFSSSVLRAAAR